MSYKIFLDDERMPCDCIGFMPWCKEMYEQKDWVIVRNYEAFIKTIEENWERDKSMPEIISFDHDLGVEMTGKDCANWLVNFCMEVGMPLPAFVVHSRNVVGAENIAVMLDGFRKYFGKKNMKGL